MRLSLLIACLLPTLGFAAGSETAPPKPSETTTVCEEGLVFDLATETCLPPEESTNEDSAMMDAVRELAYAGRYADAKRVLESMPDQDDDLVLTYYGFVTRKSGDVSGGMAFYERALAINPDNLLARSYQGQAHVEAGEMILARAQLSEIRARGGRQTWAEVSLRLAIESGRTYNY